jgi:SAM-dependent methyltransferase
VNVGRPSKADGLDPVDSQGSLPLSLLKRAHGRAVFGRRVRVLADSLAARIPPGSSVLDIGCGDGTIANLLQTLVPRVSVKGIEFAPRPNCKIECAAFDGSIIPYPAESFDVCMFVDVLHHLPDESAIQALVSEASRVSRRLLLIKDHLAESRLDFKTLQLMDWVGNRPHGIILPYSYQRRARWNQCFASARLKLCDWQDRVPLYPFPFSSIFGRKLHFIALLEKQNGQR